MKNFSFDGKVSGLMWAVIRIVAILIASVMMIMIVAGVVDNGIVRLLVGLVGLTIMMIATPSLVNSIIKYLVNNTKIEGKSLVYSGNIGTILMVVIITILIYLALSTALMALIWILYSMDILNSFISVGIVVATYLLAVTFLYSWFILHIYKMVIDNTQIRE